MRFVFWGVRKIQTQKNLYKVLGNGNRDRRERFVFIS